MATKMRIVEELLFEPFVSQLANVTVGGAKKSGARKMLTKVLGPPKAIPMPQGTPIRVSVRVDIVAKKGYVLNVVTKLGEDVWDDCSFTKEYPRKKPYTYTKTYLTVVGAEKVLDHISREREDAVRAHGIV